MEGAVSAELEHSRLGRIVGYGMHAICSLWVFGVEGRQLYGIERAKMVPLGELISFVPSRLTPITSMSSIPLNLPLQSLSYPRLSTHARSRQHRLICLARLHAPRRVSRVVPAPIPVRTVSELQSSTKAIASRSGLRGPRSGLGFGVAGHWRPHLHTFGQGDYKEPGTDYPVLTAFFKRYYKMPGVRCSCCGCCSCVAQLGRPEVPRSRGWIISFPVVSSGQTPW